MEITGTLINYYFHCKRQCYLFGNRLNLEDNSEEVKVGKAIHEKKEMESGHAEIAIDHIKIDKLTAEYLTEIKKSDADVEAAKWQLLLYLKILKSKGLLRKGKLEFAEKNKTDHKVVFVDLTEESERQLEEYIAEINDLLLSEKIPGRLNSPKCKKCAYYEYCMI